MSDTTLPYCALCSGTGVFVHIVCPDCKGSRRCARKLVPLEDGPKETVFQVVLETPAQLEKNRRKRIHMRALEIEWEKANRRI